VPEHPSVAERPGLALQSAVLSVVRERSADLAARWEAQVQTVALMSDARTRLADDGVGARRLVAALVGGLDLDDDESDEAIEHGLRFGADAFARGTSLHHTMKALDLLFAMTLYAVETAFEHVAISGSPADGVRLARQLQGRSALLSLAATRGYTQAYAEALRERFRHLRHDLRNPLGTIKSVLSLMNDESVPLDARADPRFQVMAKRNARSLEELIADRLSDAAALLPIVAGQDVSLRSIASTVRRELRGETERHGVTVLVGADAPYGRLDAPGLELLLRGALLAVLQECAEGDQLHLEFDDSVADRAIVIVSCESGRPPLEDAAALARLTSLAHQIGASLSAGERLLVSVPMGTRDEDESLAPGVIERERPIPREATGAVESVGGEPSNDVGGARQRHHGETGAH
jgi:signal transduction histidine kinase